MTEPEPKPEYCPTMSGTFSGYQPQWKHKSTWAKVNENIFGLKGGDDWADVPYITTRGGLVVKLPNGQEVIAGVPFPRELPGILESIGFCGYEQAQALAWWFAALVATTGGHIDVRVQEYRLHYDLKAKLAEEKHAA